MTGKQVEQAPGPVSAFLDKRLGLTLAIALPWLLGAALLGVAWDTTKATAGYIVGVVLPEIRDVILFRSNLDFVSWVIIGTLFLLGGFLIYAMLDENKYERGKSIVVDLPSAKPITAEYAPWLWCALLLLITPLPLKVVVGLGLIDNPNVGLIGSVGGATLVEIATVAVFAATAVADGWAKLTAPPRPTERINTHVVIISNIYLFAIIAAIALLTVSAAQGQALSIPALIGYAISGGLWLLNKALEGYNKRQRSLGLPTYQPFLDMDIARRQVGIIETAYGTAIADLDAKISGRGSRPVGSNEEI